jgi:hypothetical protein
MGFGWFPIDRRSKEFHSHRFLLAEHRFYGLKVDSLVIVRVPETTTEPFVVSEFIEFVLEGIDEELRSRGIE